ncbi:MAG: DUF2905 domain-containing protein [Chloroflexi bacterium]|nr:DUF2905 domain-containing protein [Chloroflexota bacterium]
MPGLEPMGKLLIVLGLCLAGIGLFLVLWPRIPFLGRLPVDILIQRGNFTFYFPLVTCILLSILLAHVFNVVFRFWGR